MAVVAGGMNESIGFACADGAKTGQPLPGRRGSSLKGEREGARMKRIASGAQQGESAYLSTAPQTLIRLHQHIGNGKEILGRLLTDRRMVKAWMILSSHINADDERRYVKDSQRNPYRRLWVEIGGLLLRSRRPEKTWKAIDDDLERVANLAKDLRNNIIDSVLEDGGKPAHERRRRDIAPKTGERFDFRSLEKYCPEIVKRINSQRVLIDDTDRRRGDVVEWPRLSEVLDGLIECVERERELERSRNHSVKRDKKTKAGESNRQHRAFAVELALYLEHTFNLDRKTESIPVTAAIAAAAFDQKVLRDFVRKALRGRTIST